MKIQVVEDFSELDSGQFLEVFPGPYRGRAWNDESVFVEDEAFALIEPIVRRHVADFDHRKTFKIESVVWGKIVDDLEILKGALASASSFDEVKEFLGFRSDSACEEFASNFDSNLSSLVSMIDRLVGWLREELQGKEVLSILGV